jgi:membrane protease YdiL (CAAX protease family)
VEEDEEGARPSATDAAPRRSPLEMAQRALPFVGAFLVLGGLFLGGMRVLGHEQGELERVSPPMTLEPTAEADGTLAPHRELVRAELREGEDVVFEVCAEDPLDPAVWAGKLELIVWHPADEEVVVRVPLDRERLAGLRRSSRGACILLAHGESIPIGGEYAIEAVWGAAGELPRAIRETPLVGRILGHSPLVPDDRWPVWFVLVGAIAIVVGLTRARLGGAKGKGDAAGATGTPSGRGALARTIGGLVALVAAIVVVGSVPLGGATIALGRGVLIALVEIGIAIALVGGAGVTELAPAAAPDTRAGRLGLVAPRMLFTLGVAPIAGIVLWVLGGIALRLVPATGEAPIETLVSWPSGSLALALVAVVVPVAEELFFRGFVFGQLERRFGGAVAFGATIALFALAHLPQDFGAWGALTSVLVAGAGFTAIRWLTGSTLASTLAHLAHNAIIVVLSLGAV